MPVLDVAGLQRAMRRETTRWLELMLAICVAAVIAEIAADADLESDFFSAVAQIVPVLFLAFIIEVEFAYDRRAEFFGAVERGRLQRVADARSKLADMDKLDDELQATRERLMPDAQRGDAVAQQQLDEVEAQLKSGSALRAKGEQVVEDTEAIAAAAREVRVVVGSVARRRVLIAAAAAALGELAALVALSGGPDLASAVIGYGSIAVLFLLLVTDLLDPHGRFRELPLLPE
jgi:hypothetical protein